jgi:Rap1-interacting factor 1 N terminal
MTAIEAHHPNSDIYPSRPGLPPHAANAAFKISAFLSEALPSPPESSAKSEQPTLPLNTLPSKTPDPSPVSCTTSTAEGSGKLRKKVDFSPWAVSTDLIEIETSVRSLPPSRECQSSKSILKPGRSSLLVPEDVTERMGDLPTMLDNILLQLGTADRRTRLDAYSTLWSAFKAYADLPDSHITKEKVQALLEFLRRDLTHEIGSPMEPAETNLVLQALKLLVTLVWTKSLSVHLTDTYRSFVIDHSTRIIQERKVSKAVLLHYMHLLSTQDFSSKIMTAARAVRLLEVLKDLPEHVRGNGVISERLMVYQRISEQAKGTFKSRPSSWLSQLLSAMTCSIPDTRKKAIAWGNRLPVALGSSSTVATALRDLFDSPGEQEDILSSTICKRLMKMMKSVNEARQVPQIWAVVMLLMGGLDQKLHEWHRLPDWLRIIQKCFNCSDSEARLQANKAWNKLVYVAQPYGETRSFLTKMLMKPLLVQMERPSSEKHSKTTRTCAFASYCNLLYYALKPAASFGHNDAVWDEYIVPLFKMPFLSSEQNSDSACRVLIALFWRGKLSLWKETRALDATPIEPEELPLLDCRWIRSRTRSILEVFELLFRSSYWGPALYPDTAYIAIAWRNFAKALGDACRKEVRASLETTESVTHIIQFLIRFCQNSISPNKDANVSYVSRFHFLCKTILEEVGPLPFAEGTQPVAIENPSIACNTELKSKGRPPMIDLLEALHNLPSSFKDELYFSTVSDLLQLTNKPAHLPPVVSNSTRNVPK